MGSIGSARRRSGAEETGENGGFALAFTIQAGNRLLKEIDMRLTLIAAMLAALAAVPAAGPVSQAQSQECTGENCPPPVGQGDHDCEHEKKEQTIS